MLATNGGGIRPANIDATINDVKIMRPKAWLGYQEDLDFMISSLLISF